MWIQVFEHVDSMFGLPSRQWKNHPSQHSSSEELPEPTSPAMLKSALASLSAVSAVLVEWTLKWSIRCSNICPCSDGCTKCVHPAVGLMLASLIPHLVLAMSHQETWTLTAQRQLSEMGD